MSSADISIFSPEISNPVISRNTDIDLYFNKQLLILLTFCESLKVVLITMIVFLMMATKLASPTFLKKRCFEIKDMAS